MGANTTILVVEDDANDSLLLVRQLERAQIDDNVTVVSRGEEALDFLKSAGTLPLAVFLDLKLPGMSGLEVLAKIRQDEQTRNVPVIVMTGAVNPDSESACNRLGVTAYLVKPIGITTFIKTVSHLFPKASFPDD
jgi:CheY-like chemotaxis protein